MTPLTVHSLQQLSQDVLKSSTGRLPWPEGSIMSGKLEPTPDPQLGVLQIGKYRLLAHVPTNMSKQTVWLQLVDTNLPARFRLLSTTQVETTITNMIHEHVDKSNAKQSISHTTHMEQPATFGQIDAPYRFVPVGITPLRWFITDKRDEHAPRGMLKAESTSEGFQLRGRLDLKNLGSVSFVISNSSNGIKLSLFASSTIAYQILKQDFPSWIANQKTAARLEGTLHQGTVEDETSDTRLA